MASFIVVHDVGVMSFGVDKSCDVRGLKDFGMKDGFALYSLYSRPAISRQKMQAVPCSFSK